MTELVARTYNIDLERFVGLHRGQEPMFPRTSEADTGSAPCSNDHIFNRL